MEFFQLTHKHPIFFVPVVPEMHITQLNIRIFESKTSGHLKNYSIIGKWSYQQ